MTAEVDSRSVSVGEAFGTFARLAESLQEWLQRIADRVTAVVNDVIAGFTRGYEAAKATFPGPPPPSPTKPLTPEQTAVWDQLATGIKSAKEVAVDLGFEASNEDMIRKRVARMRAGGWPIENVPGRGYWRPDAVDLDGASC